MEEAISLAGYCLKDGKGGPFGAVIVKDDKIIGRGHNKVTLLNDPTAHAEVIAIREACNVLHTFQLSDCEIYTSCEPCPMCLGAIYWARLDKIYFACTKDDAAMAGFDDSLIYKELSLSYPQRTICTEEHDRSEALPVFYDWNNLSNKIKY